MIRLREAFASARLDVVVGSLALINLVSILTVAGTAPAFAQFSTERLDAPGRREGGRGDAAIGVGIGIGVNVGRVLIENAAEEEARKKSGGGGVTTSDQKRRNRAARKGDDDPPAGGKPPPRTTSKDGNKKDKKKPEEPKDKTKPEDPKDVAIDDCIVILQYGNKDGRPRIPTKEEDPTSAQNEDIKGSAELVAKKSPNAQSGIVTDAKGQSLVDVINGFKTKGCCKRIQIFGHGTDTGQLQLPYEIGDQVGASDKLGGVPKENMHGDDADEWDRFSKALKSALCKDPKGNAPKDPQVMINACWSARTEGDHTPIASELAKSGIRTSGWTGVVDFNDGEKAQAPQGHDDNSKQTQFSASDSAAKK